MPEVPEPLIRAAVECLTAPDGESPDHYGETVDALQAFLPQEPTLIAVHHAAWWAGPEGEGQQVNVAAYTTDGRYVVEDAHGEDRVISALYLQHLDRDPSDGPAVPLDKHLFPVAAPLIAGLGA